MGRVSACRRCALHIAASEGNLTGVKVLIEEGAADPNFQDRWGNTAIDEARRVGSAPVVEYLKVRPCGRARVWPRGGYAEEHGQDMAPIHGHPKNCVACPHVWLMTAVMFVCVFVCACVCVRVRVCV